MNDDEIGPTRVDSIMVAGQSIKLVRPTDPDRLLDHPEIHDRNRTDDYMPYWAYLWPGAILLAEAVARLEISPGTKVLEIGCGLGLSGLMGLHRGLDLTFTDYDLDSLRFVRASAAANGFPTVEARQLDWRQPGEGRFPWILGADVLYERKLVPLVIDVLAALLGPGGRALISDPNRVAADSFADQARLRGFQVEVTPLRSETPEFGPIAGRLFQVS
jgi:predicted nicotinamide N-methyase